MELVQLVKDVPEDPTVSITIILVLFSIIPIISGMLFNPLFMAIPLIVFIIRIRCYFALFPFVFSDTLAGFSIAVLLVFYTGISRNDSPAIGTFNHCLHGIFYHKDKNVYLDYCRRIKLDKEVKD